MTSEDRTGIKRTTAIAWTAVTLALFLASAVFLLWHESNRPEPRTSRPSQEARQRTEGLSLLVAAANQHQDSTAVSYPAVINLPDLDNFKLQLRNIARERGWYPHKTGWKHLRLVVPESGLKVLEEMPADPAAWTRRYSQPPPNPAGASMLVNVTVRMKVENRPWPPFILTVLSFVAGTLSAWLLLMVLTRGRGKP